MRNNKRLVIRQLDEKLQVFRQAAKVKVPHAGWIGAIRYALNMTLEQFGERLGISKDGAYKLEKREASGGITLNSLRDAANALDMQLVYAVIPKDESLEAYMRTQAQLLATKIIKKTSQHMKLEAQEVGTEKLRKAIDEAAEELMNNMDRQIWHLK